MTDIKVKSRARGSYEVSFCYNCIVSRQNELLCTQQNIAFRIG